MPSGGRHLRLEILLLPLFLAGLYFMGLDWRPLLCFSAAYLFSSLWLSPDLDLRSNDARRRWGALGFIWVPYTKVFKHRGLSHNLLLGPLTRVGYLFLVGFLVLQALNYLGVRADFHLRISSEILAMIGIGLYLPNVLHILYDHFDSRVLKSGGRGQRRGYSKRCARY
ncbi:MAG: metal-binding protein [Candidatus Acetothermia bacterium]|jgi:uncharacterized metal-binding protein|nr:metal-binding protein [Candidatus Acetothermia bacterium]MDH7504544.1 DUF2227 family putative metal-binding protein [Candidatus Acetothermia bacterium]